MIVPALLCRWFGHRWRYKDYHYAIQANGRKYPFIATRVCSRCGQKHAQRKGGSGWFAYPVAFRLEEFAAPDRTATEKEKRT